MRKSLAAWITITSLLVLTCTFAFLYFTERHKQPDTVETYEHITYPVSSPTTTNILICKCGKVLEFTCTECDIICPQCQEEFKHSDLSYQEVKDKYYISN